MDRQTTFTEDDRTLLTCIKADYDHICEQFLQIKAQLQRMEARMQTQEEELADLRRREMPQTDTQMKAQLQQMESRMKMWGEELDDLRRRGLPHMDKLFGDLWEVKMDLAALRREQNARSITAEREDKEEKTVSPTLEAPEQVQ